MTSRNGMGMPSSREGVCGNNAVQFVSDGSTYCTALGVYGCTDTVSHQLRDSCCYQIDQRVPKWWSASSAKLLDAHFPSILESPETVGHYGLCRAHWFGLRWIACIIAWSYDLKMSGTIHVAQLAVDFCLRLLLSVQKSDNCTNLAVGGRRNNYCRHKTETALHHSHILSLLYVCTFSSY